MSTTIGLGYAPTSDAVFAELRALANRFSYDLIAGLNSSEAEVKSGLETAQRIEGWECIGLLQSPTESNAALAFGIHEELNELELTGTHPKFFDFLSELQGVAEGRCSKLGVFFAGEWGPHDRVRYSYGTSQQLVALLSMPGHWGIRFLIPETGRLHDSDEIPLIFDLVFK